MEILPLKLRVGLQDTLTGLLAQIGPVVLDAMQYRLYSVPNPKQAPAYGALLNYMRPWQAPAPLSVRRLHPGHGAHPVSLSVVPPGEDGSGCELWLDINDEVAGASSASQAAGHFLTLLEAAVAAPRVPIGTLPLLAPAERDTLVRACAGPRLDTSAPGGCHAPFEARAAGSPDVIAVRHEGSGMTYAELERQSGTLAARLRALGARRGRFVGIHLERSPGMVAAVLAALRSGAAYVPLDPAYPAQRLRAMLEDASPVVIITSAAGAATLPPHSARLLLIDQEEFGGEPATAPADRITGSDFAYLLYTSGSTGTPKGVLVTHANVRNYLAWRASHFPLRSADRCLHKASLCFDDSVWEILEPLCAGATVVLARTRFEHDSAYLARLMAAEAITASCFVPSLLREVIEEPAIDACQRLWRVTTGGETLPVALVRRFRERLPGATLYNGYGTTETTVASTFWRCGDEAGPGIPIGRPIANTQVYVLDAAGEPVPPGVPGEICIGGDGVSQGYLKRPALTAERFIEHPLAGPGRRLYRTGDLGRLRSDGVLEFLGRSDDQVKVRGVRIEPGDIEAVLASHPAIRAAAVVVPEGGWGRLVAFVVPRHGEIPAAAVLRDFLRDHLPAAMIPGRYERLEALPTTPAGKLDRRTLGALRRQAPEEAVPRGPADEMEARLQSIFESLLETRPIGTQDDFFCLGGHSLAAVRLATAVEESFGLTMSPEVLFEAPSIEELAQWIRAQQTSQAGEVVVPLEPEGAGTPIYLLHQIDGEVSRYRELARALKGRRPVHGIRAARLLAEAPPLERIEQMAQRYVEVIRRRQPRGPYALAGHSAGGFIALEMARLLHRAGERVDLVALLDTDAHMARRRGWRDALRYHIERVGQLPRTQRVTYLQRNLPRLALAAMSRMRRPRGAAASAAPSRSTVREAMERAVLSYRPHPYPGPLVVFRARDRRVTGTYSRTLGWKRLVMRGLQIIDVPGDHLTMLRAGTAGQLAAHIEGCLARGREELSATPRENRPDHRSPGALTPSAASPQGIRGAQRSSD
jgi:enterobactin synthetase component F